MWWPGDASTWQEGTTAPAPPRPARSGAWPKAKSAGRLRPRPTSCIANTSASAGVGARDADLRGRHAAGHARLPLAAEQPRQRGRRVTSRRRPASVSAPSSKASARRRCSSSSSARCTATPAASCGPQVRARSGRSCAEGTMPWSRYAARARSLVELGIRRGDTDRGLCRHANRAATGAGRPPQVRPGATT